MTEKEYVSYPPEAVLDIEQVAEWLQISKRAAERLDIPHLYLGTRTRRFLGSTVLEYLKKREAA